MKAASLREQTREELEQLLRDTNRELTELRVHRTTGEAAERPTRLRSLRREVARIKTVLKEQGQ